jgi:prevent-host-death family protein
VLAECLEVQLISADPRIGPAVPCAREASRAKTGASAGCLQDRYQTKFGPSQLLEIVMRYSTQIKSISYLKANAAEVLHVLKEERKPFIITQNGEAKAVIQDVASYEETQETLALLKLLALGNQQVAQGKVKPVSDVVKRLRSRPEVK